MNEKFKEYKKSFEDELDWSLLEQLHKVLLQVSNFCFYTKQICLTILVAVIGLLFKFTEDKIDTSIFVAGLVIPLCFWFLDSVAYFYQIKIRGLMDNIRQRLCERNGQVLIEGNKLRIIEKERIERNKFITTITSFFNHSMWLYFILIIINIILWRLIK